APHGPRRRHTSNCAGTWLLLARSYGRVGPFRHYGLMARFLALGDECIPDRGADLLRQILEAQHRTAFAHRDVALLEQMIDRVEAAPELDRELERVGGGHEMAVPPHVRRHDHPDIAFRPVPALDLAAVRPGHGIALAGDGEDIGRRPVPVRPEEAAARHLADMVGDGALHRLDIDGAGAGTALAEIGARQFQNVGHEHGVVEVDGGATAGRVRLVELRGGRILDDVRLEALEIVIGAPHEIGIAIEAVDDRRRAAADEAGRLRARAVEQLVGTVQGNGEQAALAPFELDLAVRRLDHHRAVAAQGIEGLLIELADARRRLAGTDLHDEQAGQRFAADEIDEERIDIAPVPALQRQLAERPRPIVAHYVELLLVLDPALEGRTRIARHADDRLDRIRHHTLPSQ